MYHAEAQCALHALQEWKACSERKPPLLHGMLALAEAGDKVQHAGRKAEHAVALSQRRCWE